MPLEGSVRGAPKTGDVVKQEVVERYRDQNMYFSAVGFINDVKSGPFWEHSPILFDISGVRDGWGKINKVRHPPAFRSSSASGPIADAAQGMLKMFHAEVLSKFPVVQHFPFGSLFSWDEDPAAAAPAQTIHVTNQPAACTASPAAGTPAPWASAAKTPASAGPGIPYSRVPPPRTAIPGTAATRMPPAAGARMPPPTGTRMPAPAPAAGSAAAQQTITRAPWAKDG